MIDRIEQDPADRPFSWSAAAVLVAFVVGLVLGLALDGQVTDVPPRTPAPSPGPPIVTPEAYR